MTPENLALFGSMVKADARAAITLALAERGGRSMTELATSLGLELGLVSRHIAIMASAHFVVVEKVGRDSSVSLAPEWAGVVGAITRFGNEEGDEDERTAGD